MAKGKLWTIAVDGTTTSQDFDRKVKLEELQKVVGGYIEHVPVGKDGKFNGERAVAFINEEGKLKGLAYNKVATDLVNEASPGFKFIDHIVGPMVILTGDKAFLK
jgi:hypothetical protein